MTVDLRLEYLGDGRSVATDHTDVIEDQTCNIDDSCKPVPVYRLDKQLANDDMHDQREGDAASEPMRLCLSIGIDWSCEALHARKERCQS